MPLRSSDQDIRERLDVGWYFFACAVFLAIITADYQGPIIAIAFGLLAAGSGLILIRNFPTPRFPSAGYWLIGILVLGLLSAIAADVSGATTLNIDLQRDLGTTVSYILFLTVGYYFAYSRTSLRVLLIAIAAAGLVISAIQLLKAGIVLSDGVKDLYLFRLNAGRGSKSQFAALCACVLLLRDGVVAKYRPMILVTAATITISMLSVLGRGLMADLIVFGIVLMGVTTNRSETLIPDVLKFIFIIISAAAVIMGTYVALRFVLPPVRQFIDDFFVTKLENSLREVSGTGLESRSQIAANYRAFELDRTIQQFEEQSSFAQWLGQGWGTTVQFGFETASTKANFSRTNAPFLHNGYAYYLMKAGIIGLLLYIGFLLHLASRAVTKAKSPSGDAAVLQRKILLAATVVLAFSTVAGGGLGFPAIYFGLLALIGACFGPVWGPDCEGDVSNRETLASA
jgi:hypothetical protein